MNLDLFPHQRCVVKSSVKVASSHQPRDHGRGGVGGGVKPFCIHTTIPIFTFSTGVNELHRYSTLDQTGFAQLSASECSGQSWVFGRLGVFSAFSTYDIANLWGVYWDTNHCKLRKVYNGNFRRFLEMPVNRFLESHFQSGSISWAWD